jgi:hypothetical protein
MARVIVLAAGEASRWGNYLDVPKHFVDIGGEPLLHRTVRQFSSYGEIIITGPDADRYHVEGASLYVPEAIPESWDTKKFLDNVELWDPTGRTILLWGDTYYSDAAVKTIMDHEPVDWLVYGRMSGSEITGCGYGEIFAYSFMSQAHRLLKSRLERLRWMRKHQRIGRCGGWEFYRLLSGAKNLNEHRNYGKFVEINDDTEDFDFPHDYQRWAQNVLGITYPDPV